MKVFPITNHEGRLSNKYSFTKPNDRRALDLINRAAQSTFRAVPDLCIAYGVSDEYSFVFHKSTSLFERRASKLISTVVSAFTAAYVFHWQDYFRNAGDNSMTDEGNEEPHSGMLLEDWLPTFDGRAVCYPSVENLRDYLSWRQVDCHINNLYNTTFWALVQQGGQSVIEAEATLSGTFAADKNEILFSKFGINYNNEDEMYKKGSVVFREYQLVEPMTASATDNTTTDILVPEVESRAHSDKADGQGQSSETSTTPVLSKTQLEKARKARQKAKIVVVHLDIIKDDFWNRRPWILSGKPGAPLQA